MPKDAFSGKLLHDDVESASFVMSPDAAWLRFVEKMSQPAALGSGGTTVFSAKDFVDIYKIRREKLEKISSLIVDRG
jgi:hypothetical protein